LTDCRKIFTVEFIKKLKVGDCYIAHRTLNALVHYLKMNCHKIIFILQRKGTFIFNSDKQ